MANKYRGKYKKCRTCKHVIDVHMVIVEVKPECPKHVVFSCGLFVDKKRCETCEHWEAKTS